MVRSNCDPKKSTLLGIHDYWTGVPTTFDLHCSFSLRTIETNGKHMTCQFMGLAKKPGRGVKIMAIGTCPNPVLLDYQINPGQIEELFYGVKFDQFCNLLMALSVSRKTARKLSVRLRFRKK